MSHVSLLSSQIQLVDFGYLFIILFFRTQVTEDPTVAPIINRTWLKIAFSSNSIHIQKEEEAFSFGSMVADCGGVLGLFIGFNFMMVWEWLVVLKSILKVKVRWWRNPRQ